MRGYTQPQSTTNPAGLGPQTGAVAQAVGTQQTTLSQLTSAVAAALRQLASPASSTSSTSALSRLLEDLLKNNLIDTNWSRHWTP